MHGKRLKVAQQLTLKESLIASGFPADQKGALPQNLKSMVHLAPLVRNIRTSGAAALHLAYLAAGRITGFWEMSLNSWDLAAGSLLIQEAGGRVTDLDGLSYHLGVRDVVASNGFIHDALLAELKESRK